MLKFNRNLPVTLHCPFTSLPLLHFNISINIMLWSVTQRQCYLYDKVCSLAQCTIQCFLFNVLDITRTLRNLGKSSRYLLKYLNIYAQVIERSPYCLALASEHLLIYLGLTVTQLGHNVLPIFKISCEVCMLEAKRYVINLCNSNAQTL